MLGKDTIMQKLSHALSIKAPLNDKFWQKTLDQITVCDVAEMLVLQVLLTINSQLCNSSLPDCKLPVQHDISP